MRPNDQTEIHSIISFASIIDTLASDCRRGVKRFIVCVFLKRLLAYIERANLHHAAPARTVGGDDGPSRSTTHPLATVPTRIQVPSGSIVIDFTAVVLLGNGYDAMCPRPVRTQTVQWSKGSSIVDDDDDSKTRTSDAPGAIWGRLRPHQTQS